MIVIAVTGMKRSGSTWMFNVARLAHDIAGNDVWAGGPAPDGLAAINDLFHDVYVIKEHRWNPDLASVSDYVLTSNRDYEGVKRSMEAFRGREIGRETMDAWIERLSYWKAQSDYHMRYDDLVAEPGVECRAIIEVLDLDADTLRRPVMNRLAEAMQPPEGERQDPDSLVFEDHYTSRSPDEIAKQHET